MDYWQFICSNYAIVGAMFCKPSSLWVQIWLIPVFLECFPNGSALAICTSVTKVEVKQITHPVNFTISWPCAGKSSVGPVQEQLDTRRNLMPRLSFLKVVYLINITLSRIVSYIYIYIYILHLSQVYICIYGIFLLICLLTINSKP